ncbi:MAG: DUF3501 family protein [Gemmataceae bacterium]
MLPLTLNDLLPLQEYSARRREFFESLGRYLDRYRRVRVGPKATLLFENRQTLWFRVHEIIRIARLSDKTRLQEELNWYNTLLPGKNNLQAVLMIDVDDESRLVEELENWRTLTSENVRFRIGQTFLTCQIVTCRPEDLWIGAAYWVQFDCNRPARSHLANFSQPAYLEIAIPGYEHQSDMLSDDVRQSLVDDLELSDKDEGIAA